MAAQREAELVGAEVCVRARQVGEKFRKPDDDWAPVLFVWRDDGVRALMHLQVPPIEYGGHLRTVLFQNVMPELIRDAGGTAAAIVFSSWLVKSADVDEARQVKAYSDSGRSFEQYPGRIEAVSVTAADAEGPMQWIAEIKRDGQSPPTLGEWELWEAALDGRIAAGLLKGVGG